MGWTPGLIRRKCEKIRLWNCFIDMPDNRIKQKVFLWSKILNSPLAPELHDVLREAEQQNSYKNNLPYGKNAIRKKVSKFGAKWRNYILLQPKLFCLCYIILY